MGNEPPNSTARSGIGKSLALWATILAGGAAVLQLAYSAGKDVGEKNLSSYQEAQKLSLPDLVESLSATTVETRRAMSEFKNMLVESASYEQIKAQLGALNQEAGELRQQKASLEVALGEAIESQKNLSSQLAALKDTSQVYEIDAGHAQTLYGGLITVGLVNVSPTDVAILKLEGVAHEVTAGDIIRLPEDRSGCTIRMREIQYISSRVRFTADCDLDAVDGPTR